MPNYNTYSQLYLVCVCDNLPTIYGEVRIFVTMLLAPTELFG